MKYPTGRELVCKKTHEISDTIVFKDDFAVIVKTDVKNYTRIEIERLHRYKDNEIIYLYVRTDEIGDYWELVG